MAYSDGVPLLPGDGAAGDRHDASAIEAHRQAAHGTDELLRQLARRAEHQGLWPAGRRHSHVQALKQRQAKDNRLAAASLRLADHVAPGERGWQGPLLDVRQRRVPQALGASEQLWAERAQALKRQSFRSHGRERHAPEGPRHRPVRARREQRGVARAEGEHSPSALDSTPDGGGKNFASRARLTRDCGLRLGLGVSERFEKRAVLAARWFPRRERRLATEAEAQAEAALREGAKLSTMCDSMSTRSSWHWQGHLRPEVPSRSRTAALRAPEQSSGRAPQCSPRGSLSPRSAA